MSTLTKAGRYELREELGRGAMGVVHRGFDPVIGRDVAVKTLHLSEEGTGMSRDELVSRFQTEARAAGLLTHPNIVVVYDAGEEEGLFYITMELVEGRSLQSLLDARQTFPLARVLKLVEQICSALQFAHQHNVVHRDIKPANLMLTANDTVKITDFGTAKILQFGTAQTAHVMGTPSYMSPEQVKGKPVDGRSDIFSLGVILYELMTGEKPFPGQNITTVIYKIINEEPVPPRSLDSSIHVGLSAVIKRALAKDPADRYQSCQEFLDALKNFHEQSDPNATAKIKPAAAQARTSAIREAGHAEQPFVLPPGERHAPEAQPVLLIPASPEDARPGASKQGIFLISLLLLGVIAFAGYRIWAPMVDLWQRVHEKAEAPGAAAKTAPAPEAVQDISTAPVMQPSAAPDSKSDAVPVAPVAQPASLKADGASQPDAQPVKPTPVAAETTKPQQTPASEISAKPSVTPTPGGDSKTAKPQSLFAAAAMTSAAISLKTTLESKLKALSLADKVTVQVIGSNIELSGRLTPTEHRKLLNLLHTLPAGIRVIDNIEYSEEPAEN